MADTIVTAEKLNEIKTKLNNELRNRRTYTYHGINVNQYQGSAWDFTAVPGREITNDQLHKLIDPMLQINDFMQDNTLIGDKPTTIPDLTTVEKFVDNLTTKSQTSSDSGCRGSCAGLCYGACYSGCTGCSSCSGSSIRRSLLIYRIGVAEMESCYLSILMEFFYPCIRYMESSLNGQQEPYSIGDVDNGIGYCDCYKCRLNCLNSIDRRTQSADECFYCPIAEGCSWCSAYNYQVFGTPDKRATFICVMHKARALGNYYFWNKYYRKHDLKKRMEIFVPDEWALEIISEKELNMLKELAR